MTNKVSCIVLSAGYSSRMGDTHKSLLPFGGYKSMIEKVIHTVLESGVDDIYVVLGYNEEKIAESIGKLNVKILYNKEFNKGMFSSVFCGISALGSDVDATFLLPVDAALVKSSSLISLLARREENYKKDNNFSVVIPTFLNKCGHPPLIEKSHFKNILDCYNNQHLKENQYGLRGYFSSLVDDSIKNDFLKGEFANGLVNNLNQIDFFSIPDEGVVSDLDTFDDYKYACETLIATEDRKNPTLKEAFHLLINSNIPLRTKKHSLKVALGALRLGISLKRNMNLDFDILNCAVGGLLHDICRNESKHAKVGAEYLRTFGWFRTAAIVASHTNLSYSLLNKFDIYMEEEKLYVEDVSEFIEDNSFLFSSFCVYLSDKFYQSDNHITLHERHSNIKMRYADNPEALLAIQSRENVASAVKNYFDDTTNSDAYFCVEEKTENKIEEELLQLIIKYNKYFE